MNKKLIPIFSLFILFGAGGYLWWSYSNSQDVDPTVSERGAGSVNEPSRMFDDMNTKKESGPLKEVDTIEFENTTLVDVSGHEASATAQRRINSQGVFEHTVVTENLQKPGADRFYEGWLVRPEPFHFISTGIMDLRTDGNYELNFESDNLNLMNYPEVVITLEAVDDGSPEDHILEGSF